MSAETSPKPPKPSWVQFWDAPGLIDLIRDQLGCVKFLVLDQGHLAIRDHLILNRQNVPPPGTVLYPLSSTRVLEFYDNDDDQVLFHDVTAFIRQHVELPQDADIEYDLLGAWVLHTCLMERFETTPYLHFYGPFESGKTRASSTLREISRHGLSTVGITEAALFRASEYLRPTLFIDELQVPKDHPGVLDLLNARYKRGARIVRVNMDKSGPDSLEGFEVFGATVISTTASFDQTLTSRCLVFQMLQNRRGVRDSIDKETAAVLRDRLTAFRARHILRELPISDRPPCEGRLRELVAPIHSMILLGKPSAEQQFREYVAKINGDRSAEIQEGVEYDVVCALLECEHLVLDGKFLVGHIVSKINEDRAERDKLDSRKVGSVLKRLGFGAVKHHGNTRMRYMDRDRLGRLAIKYGLQSRDTPEDTSHTSQDVPEV